MTSPQMHEISLDAITGLQKVSLKARNEQMSKGEYKTKSLKHRPDPSQPKLKNPVGLKPNYRRPNTLVESRNSNKFYASKG